MKKFTASVKRALNKKPRDRPAKLRKLQEEIDGTQESPLVSPATEGEDVSPLAASFGGSSSKENDRLVPITEEERPAPEGGDVRMFAEEQAVAEAGPGLEAAQDDLLVDDSEPYEAPEAGNVDSGQEMTYEEYRGTPAAEAVGQENAIKPQPDLAHIIEATDLDQPLSQQALREEKYLHFDGEDETDYTEGPVRLVDAFDGAKECGALLLNLDLSIKIQQALRAQRDFDKSERRATRELEVALGYESQLGREIAVHQSRLVRLEEGENEEERKTVAEELEVLELMLSNAKVERQSIKQRTENLGGVLRELQREVNAYLEDAFTYGQLLEPLDDSPDTPVEEKDLQTEYQSFRALLQQGGGTTQEIDDRPLDTGAHHLEAEPMNPQLQAQQELIDSYWEAKQAYQAAEAAFENRRKDRIEEQTARDHALATGAQPFDKSQEAFDSRWFQRVSDLTREYKAAETAFYAAKQVLLEAGLQLMEPDRASGFLSHASDGYAESLEQAMIQLAPKPKIEKWFDNMSTPESPQFDEVATMDGEGDGAMDIDGDSVSVCAPGNVPARYVGLIDSASVVADETNSVKRQIDRWERIRSEAHCDR